MDYISDEEILIGTKNGLYLLKNRKNLDLLTSKRLTINSIFVENRNNIFLGTDDFIYYTTNGGFTWEYSYEGMEHLGHPDIWMTKAIKKIKKEITR